MISMVEHHELNQDLMLEGNILKAIFRSAASEDKEIADMINRPKIKEFLKLSQSLVKNSKLGSKDMSRFEALLSDKEVTKYLELVQQTARESGLIGGAIEGSLLGSILGAGLGFKEIGTTTLLGLPTAPPLGIAAFALLGAALGGVALGALIRKVAGYLAMRQTKESLRKQALGIKPVSIQ